MSKIKLESCPFCGAPASFVDCEIPPRWFVRCQNGCCEQSNLYLSRESAAKEWNRRANERTE